MIFSDYLKYQKRIVHLYDYMDEQSDKYIFYDCYINDIKNIPYHWCSKVEFIKSDTNVLVVNFYQNDDDILTDTLEIIDED